MSVTWAEHALRTLERAGYRASAPRTEVVAALGELDCGTNARELADRLRARGSAVGVASIYRTLDLLDRLRLVQRFELGEGGARYEPAYPSGEHHHHLVCESCGDVAAFEDRELERAIERLAGRVQFTVAGHDVVLRGECPACHAGD